MNLLPDFFGVNVVIIFSCNDNDDNIFLNWKNCTVFPEIKDDFLGKFQITENSVIKFLVI